MNEIPKNMIGLAGKYFTQAMFIRHGLPTSVGKDNIDLVVHLKKPRRIFDIFVVSNLHPKLAGGKGKEALDWWVPRKVAADLIACVDLSMLRIYLFERDEFVKFAQQRTATKYHLYMYTEKAVDLRGKKSMKFDYEFEPYRLENRVHRGIFEKRIKHADTKKNLPTPLRRGRPPRRKRASKRAARKG